MREKDKDHARSDRGGSIHRATDTLGGSIERTGPKVYTIHLTEQHMCGLSGYGAPGDTCPACEQSRNLRARLAEYESWDDMLTEMERYLAGEPLPGTTKPLYDAMRKLVPFVRSVIGSGHQATPENSATTRRGEAP
jgi:hypothetical protein